MEIKLDIQRSRLTLFEHVMQMTEERIPKIMPYTKIGGKRSRARQRTRWID